jgi:hypothetical protein
MIFINLSGQPGPLASVRQIGAAMANPVGRPSLEIRSMKLSKEDPGDALLEPKPVVDEFGQWIPEEWPGKIRNLDALRQAWAAEEKALAAGGDMPYCRFGGYKASQAKATGYFRAEKVDGKWWLVDPDGHLFLSMGADSIGTAASTSTQGREQLFAALPPQGFRRGAGRPRQGGFTPGTWFAVSAPIGATSGWTDRAAHVAWGFNTVGN